MAQWRKLTDRGKPNCSNKIAFQVHFVQYRSHMNWTVMEPLASRWPWAGAHRSVSDRANVLCLQQQQCGWVGYVCSVGTPHWVGRTDCSWPHGLV